MDNLLAYASTTRGRSLRSRMTSSSSPVTERALRCWALIFGPSAVQVGAKRSGRLVFVGRRRGVLEERKLFGPREWIGAERDRKAIVSFFVRSSLEKWVTSRSDADGFCYPSPRRTLSLHKICIFRSFRFNLKRGHVVSCHCFIQVQYLKEIDYTVVQKSKWSAGAISSRPNGSTFLLTVSKLNFLSP